MTRLRHVVAPSIVASVLLASAGCTSSGGSDPTSSAPAPARTSSSSSSSSSRPSTAPEPVAANPFTGIGPVPNRPTIAVKIDDTAPGRPQLGINKADIVYIEAVEGGLTRLAAIFGTYKPPAVGYVRSTRPSDPELLLQYGKITEAYSGGAHDSLPRVRRSGIRSWSNDAGARFYSRRSRASSYINLVLNLARVADVVRTPFPQDIGWTFDARLTGVPTRKGMVVRTEVTGSYRHGTPVVFKYSAKRHKYLRYIDGAVQYADGGAPVAATNVIVQKCKVRPHPQDTDVNGNPSQFTYTVGTGPAVIFRDGKRIDGTWTRHKPSGGTVWRTTTGTRIPLAPGNTWVVLVRKGVPVFS